MQHDMLQQQFSSRGTGTEQYTCIEVKKNIPLPLPYLFATSYENMKNPLLTHFTPKKQHHAIISSLLLFLSSTINLPTSVR